MLSANNETEPMASATPNSTPKQGKIQHGHAGYDPA